MHMFAPDTHRREHAALLPGLTDIEIQARHFYYDRLPHTNIYVRGTTTSYTRDKYKDWNEKHRPANAKLAQLFGLSS